MATTRRPIQQRSNETKQKIIDTAKILIAEKGYSGTNTKEIAREAGLAVGSIYAYFPDKGDIFIDIAHTYYEIIFEQVRSAIEDISLTPLSLLPTGRRRMISKLIHILHDAHDIDPALHREISLMILASNTREGTTKKEHRVYTAIREEVDRMDREVLSWLEQLIGRAFPKCNSSIAARLVYRTCEETIHRIKMFPESEGDAEKLLEELILMIDRYLAEAR